MKTKKKNLLKEGRPIKEYINEDGSLKVHCFTCLNRDSIKEAKLGGWLCSGQEKMMLKCNPNYLNACKTNDNDSMYDFLLWEPRVTNGILEDDDWELD